MRQAFLEAILTSPEDDTQRLVFADWLEEQGETAYPEFIRLQCEAAALRKQPGWTPSATEMAQYDGDTLRNLFELNNHDRERKIGAAKRRANELFGKHGTDWLADFYGPFAGISAKMERGFVGSITCRAAEWFTNADAITAAHPIRTVRLTSWPGRYFEEQAPGPRGPLRLYGRQQWHDFSTIRQDVPLREALLAAEWPRIKFEVPPQIGSAATTMNAAGNRYRTWTGAARDNDLGNPANWRNVALPETGDTVSVGGAHQPPEHIARLASDLGLDSTNAAWRRVSDACGRQGMPLTVLCECQRRPAENYSTWSTQEPIATMRITHLAPRRLHFRGDGLDRIMDCWAGRCADCGAILWAATGWQAAQPTVNVTRANQVVGRASNIRDEGNATTADLRIDDQATLGAINRLSERKPPEEAAP